MKRYPAAVLFFGLIFLLMACDLVTPDQKRSWRENRNLAQKPSCSAQQILNGTWMQSYTDYCKDQFFLRDGWIRAYSVAESLLFQKKEVGNMIAGDGAVLFPKVFALKETQEKQLQKNQEALIRFAEKNQGRVTVMLVPSAAAVFPERLPAQAPLYDENAIRENVQNEIKKEVQKEVQEKEQKKVQKEIQEKEQKKVQEEVREKEQKKVQEEIQEKEQGKVPEGAEEEASEHISILDVKEILHSQVLEKVYYKTDHHWTTEGAYLAYKQFCAEKGKIPFAKEDHIKKTAGGFFGTSDASFCQWNRKPDEIVWYEPDHKMTRYRITGDGEAVEEETAGMYQKEKLSGRDKYGMFLYGNGGYNVIDGDGNGSILVIKDSYANCFVPFLTADYEKIGVMDLRNYTGSPMDRIREDSYDEILILYSFSSFYSDSSIQNLQKND